MCGIAGFFGKPDRTFNRTVLNYLLMAQDSRGRDNFGIVYTVPKDEDKPDLAKFHISRGENSKFSGGEDVSTFKKVFEKKGYPWIDENPKFDNPTIIIGHSRRTSRGSIDVYNAHPFVCSNTEKIEDSTRTLIGVHNGTLYNDSELAKKFKIDATNMDTDSEVLFSIMARSQETAIEALKSYRGAAALVWTIKQKPGKVFVWVGNERYKAYTDPERPLHYIQTQDGLYISSEDKPLEDIMLAVPNWKDYVGSEIVCASQFETDAITVIDNGEIEEVHPLKRHSISTYQTNTYKSKKDQSNTTTGMGGRCSSNLPLPKVITRTKQDLDYKKILAGDIHTSTEIQDFSRKGQLYVQKGLYYFAGKPAHTKVEIDKDTVAMFPNDSIDITGSTYFTSSGYSLLKKHKVNGEEYFCYNDDFNATLGKIMENEVVQLYFYNGLLIKDRQSLIEIHKDIATSGVINARKLRSITNMPIWAGMFSELTVGRKLDSKTAVDIVLFSPPLSTEDKVGLKNSFVTYPYTRKAYYFIDGKIADIIDGWRYSHINLHPEKARFCNKCLTTVIKDCDDCVDNLYNKLAFAYNIDTAEGVSDYRVQCLDCNSDVIQTERNYCVTCGSINIQSTSIDPVGNDSSSEQIDEAIKKVKQFFEEDDK